MKVAINYGSLLDWTDFSKRKLGF